MFHYAFLLTILAGSATLFGIVPILFRFRDTNKVIICSLSFASGVMISASFFDLIPEAYLYFSSLYNSSIFTFLFLAIFFVMGILISTYINKHLSFKEDNLYKVGINIGRAHV